MSKLESFCTWTANPEEPWNNDGNQGALWLKAISSRFTSGDPEGDRREVSVSFRDGYGTEY